MEENIQILDLSIASYNSLRTRGVWTINELIDIIDSGEIFHIRHLKDSHINEIQTKLQEYLSTR